MNDGPAPKNTSVMLAPLLDPGAGREELTLPDGLTLHEIVQTVLPGLPANSGNCRVALVTPNGVEFIDAKYWHHVRPRPGVRVIVRVIPGKNALRSILLIAVTIAAVAIGGLLGPGLANALGISTELGIALTTLGVNVLGNLLVNALIPPPKPDEAENRYQLAGWKNRYDPNGAVPVVLGDLRYSPPFAALSWTEIVGDDQYIRALFNFGYGELTIDDFRIGETSIAEYDEVEIEVRSGLAGDVPISLYPRQIAEESIGVELTRPLPRDDLGEIIEGDPGIETPVVRTTGADASGASIILAWPAGLVRMNDKGSSRSYTVEIKIEQRLIEAVEWQLVTTLTVSAKKLEAFYRQHSWNFPSRGRWQLRLTMMTDENRSNQIQARTSWALIQTIRPEYPLNFNQPLALCALRIKATHQLNGQLDDFNARARRVLPDWDYLTETWIKRHSSNPAAHYRYVLQSAANPKPAIDAALDLAQIQDWHDFCRLKGLKYDKALDQPTTTLRDVLTEIAVAGRASPRHDGLKWGVTIDRPQELDVDFISPRNSWDFKASRSYVDPPDGFKIKFLDAANDYQPTERLVPWPGHTGPILLTEALELPGKTDAAEIWIEARRRMYESLYRPDSYRVMQDGPARVATRGDQVMLSHNILDQTQVATRVKTTAGQLVELDEVVEMVEGQDYAVRFRVFANNPPNVAPDTIGTSIVRTVLNVTGAQQVLTLTGEGPTPLAESLIHFGLAAKESLALIVTGVESAGDFSNVIHLVDAAPIIDELIDAEVVPAWSSRIGAEIADNLLLPSAPRFTSISSGYAGTGEPGQVDYLIVPGSGSVSAGSLEIEYRLVGAPGWTVVSIPVANGGGSITDFVVGDLIELRARALSAANIEGPYTTLISLTVGAQDAGIPAELETDSASVTGGMGNAIVAFATGVDTDTTQVQIYRAMTATLDRETDAVGGLIAVAPQSTFTVPIGDITRTNLLANGDFADASAWVLDASWEIIANEAQHTGSSYDYIKQAVGFVTGKFYRISFTQRDGTGGSVRPRFLGGSELTGVIQTANGTFYDRLQALSGNNTFGLRGSTSFDGALDDVSLFLETAACLDQGTHYFWIEPQNEDGVPGPVSGPFTVSIL